MENQAKIAEPRKPYFFYGQKDFEVKQGNKKATVTRRVAFAGTLNDDKTMNIGQAICSEKDYFTKAKARAIATGRSFKKPYVILKLEADGKPGLQFNNHCKKLINE